MPSPLFNFASVEATALELGEVFLLAFALFAVIYPLAARFSSRRSPSAPSLLLFPMLLLALAGIISAMSGVPQLTNNIRSTLAVFIVFLVIYNLPLVFFYCRRAQRCVPPALQEAAILDGASPAQQFRHISLPLLLPWLTVGFLLTSLQTVAAWILFPIGQAHLGNAAQPATSSSTAVVLALAVLVFIFTAAMILEARAQRSSLPPTEARLRLPRMEVLLSQPETSPDLSSYGN